MPRQLQTQYRAASALYSRDVIRDDAAARNLIVAIHDEGLPRRDVGHRWVAAHLEAALDAHNRCVVGAAMRAQLDANVFADLGWSCDPRAVARRHTVTPQQRCGTDDDNIVARVKPKDAQGSRVGALRRKPEPRALPNREKR